MCRKAVVFAVVVLMFLMTGSRSVAQESPAFYLKNADTVVFYGDSITEQNLYNQFVELYTVTRFPGMRVHFYGSGVGGDRVTGGGAGTIDERLARDVFPHRPTVITVMLGMNDGSYRATTDEIQSAYVKGYEHLLESIHTHAPDARVTLLGPSPFDDVTRPVMFPGGYNAVMLHFGILDQELARKRGLDYVSLNSLLVAGLERAQGMDPMTARLIVPDRVHPEMVAHWIMAESLLKGWNAPALVSSVTIDGRESRAAQLRNASVSSIERENHSLRWTVTENALPLPFNANNESQALLLKISDIQHALNQESLLVTGLDAGSYELKVDTTLVGRFSSADLAKGINLADYETPMRNQAQRVAWLVRDREEAHYVHMRMQVRKADTGEREGNGDLLSAFETSLEDSIYDVSKPAPHTFTLTRLDGQP